MSANLEASVTDSSPRITMTRSGALVSTLFVYVSPTIQNAANSVYQQKVAADAAFSTINSFDVYRFKTDRERMQYLIGRMGQATTYS